MTFEIEYQVFQNNKMIADFTGEYKRVCEVKSPNLEMGRKYNYNFILPVDASNSVITFTTTVYGWVNGSNSSVTLPNNPTMQSMKNLLAEQGDYIESGEIKWDKLFTDNMASWPNPSWDMDAKEIFTRNNSTPEKEIKKLMTQYQNCVEAAANGDSWPWSPSDYLAVINNVKYACNIIWNTLPESARTYEMRVFLGLDL